MALPCLNSALLYCLCVAPLPASAFSYSLYNDSACTLPLLNNSRWSNISLTYSPKAMPVCLAQTVAGSPTVRSVSFFSQSLAQTGTPAINFWVYFYPLPSCMSSPTSFAALPGMGAYDSVQSTGMPQGVCSSLLLPIDGSTPSYTAVYGVVSADAAPFPSSAPPASLGLPMPLLVAMVVVAAVAAVLGERESSRTHYRRRS